MDPQLNPYEPPKSHIHSEAFAPRGPSMKRPASHKWAIAMFLIFLILTAFAVPGLIQVRDSRPVIIVGLILCFWFVLPTIALLFFRYAQATYYITSVALGFVVIPFGLSTISSLGMERTGSGFVMFGNVFWLLIFVLLWWKFSLGKPSRTYFGFPVPETPDAGSKPVKPGEIQGKKRPDGWDVNY